MYDAHVGVNAIGNAIGNSIVAEMRYNQAGDADYPAREYEQEQARRNALANPTPLLPPQQMKNATEVERLNAIGVPPLLDANGNVAVSGSNAIPDGAYPMNMRYPADADVGPVSALGQMFGDDPSNIFQTYSIPKGAESLHDYIDPFTRQLKSPELQSDFYKAAQGLGLSLAVQVPGIANDYYQGYYNGEIITGGRNDLMVMNVYNPSGGIVADLMESLALKFGLDTGATLGVRASIFEAMDYNRRLDVRNGVAVGTTATEVFGHSEGTLIANEALSGFKSAQLGRVGLYNLGTAAGNVPEGLRFYRNVVNSLDPVTKLGGVTNSLGYTNSVANGADYSSLSVTFDAYGSQDRWNHSLYLYAGQPSVRQYLGWSAAPTKPLVESWVTPP